MRSVLNHSIPEINVNDILVIEFRDFEQNGYIMAKALTEDVRFTLETYFDIDATENAPASSTDYVMELNGSYRRIDLPESGVFQNRVTRMVITKGRVALDITSPSPARYYIEQPENPPRIA